MARRRERQIESTNSGVAQCAHCHRQVFLKSGKLARHKTDLQHDRGGNRLWCLASGTEDWYREGDLGKTWRLVHKRCPVCHRSIGLDPRDEILLGHLDGGRVCDGSGDPGYDGDQDNSTPGGSGFAWLPTPEPILIEVPRVGAKAQALADWWAARALAEIEMVVAKAVEYGATDLRDLGYQMLDMAGRREQFMDPEDLHYSDAYATEVGIVFYAQGKLARAVAAIKEGRRPSVDTWLDLGIYARMAQRVHDRGAWPGV